MSFTALHPLRETWRGARTILKVLKSTAPHAPPLRPTIHRLPNLPSAPNGGASLSHQFVENAHSVARLAFEGVFRSLKGGNAAGGFKGGHSRLYQNPTKVGFGVSSSAARGRYSASGIGRASRPSLRPSFASPQLGLQSARNFSSSQPLMANIVNNIPLGLRALADQDGFMDRRKWRAMKREIRAGRNVENKGKAVEGELKARETRAAFGEFFGGVEVVEEMSIPSVLLVLPLEPELPFASSSSLESLSPSSSSFTNFRLLTPAVMHTLESIQSAYTHHSHLIRALSNRLTSAGVFDDPTTTIELCWREDGNKEVHVTFMGEWRIGDVRQALGVWPGEATWFDLVDLRESKEKEPTTSEREAEEMEHDTIVSTFVLPSLDDATRSLSPVSSVWLDDVASQSSYEYSFDQEELVDHHWEEESYDEEVRTFLSEVEEAQRGRLLDFSML